MQKKKKMEWNESGQLIYKSNENKFAFNFLSFRNQES